jgi:hypothetical protein
VLGVGQVIASRESVPEGTLWLAQVAPPFVVAMRTLEVPPSDDPTA